MVVVDESGYWPIEDYGLIGNLETCALVGPDGAVEWFPFPHVESPTILAAILDPDRGGRFRIAPRESFEANQRYIDRTNVLETRFETDRGIATVTDFMPPAGEVGHPRRVLYRNVACLEGTIHLEVIFEPAFDYGRAQSTITAVDGAVHASGGGERTVLEGPINFDVDSERATGAASLAAGEDAWILLRCTGAENAAVDPEGALRDTVAFWRDWVHDCNRKECVFRGTWHDLAVRSELALKLLTHVESGAIVAAPTASLPEDVGGVRNWDYRFNWLRDAGFTIQALLNLGHVAEAIEYFEWFMEICETHEPAEMQPLYGVHGESNLEERELDHLAGYRHSRPVRIGNGAAEQRQLDIYGEILLAVDEMLRHGWDIDAEEWAAVRDIVDYVANAWTEPDAGIWEVRGGYRQFVYSKVMCWVALDRGIAIASDWNLVAPLEAWRVEREVIRADILENGFDDDLGAFVQAYDTDALDATGLLFPLVGFLSFGDDRVQGTIRAIEDLLIVDDALVRRYDGDDGLPGPEGAFVLCSCWLTNALALSGRVDDARARFAALTNHVNPLGLAAEELDPHTGAYLGNYPQAFSHIGLINSTLYLGYAIGHEHPGQPPMGVRLGEPLLGGKS